MNYKQAGFRAFYQHFCVVPITEKTKPVIEGMAGIEQSNGILTYGYYDREAGLTLEVLGLAYADGKTALFSNPVPDMRGQIRIGAVEEEDFLFFADDDGRLSEKYRDKLKILERYRADEAVEKTREMAFLDDSRHEYFIDDVMVFLTKDGCRPEGCWVRISGLLEHALLGRLLNEPDQDFGCHEGDEISFQLERNEEKRMICCSDLNPVQQLAEKALEDGSLLEYAVSAFAEERSRERFFSVLQILRDSEVYIPCDAKGETAEEIRPMLLQNGEKVFLPIFSSKQRMGEGTVCVRKPVADAIRLLKANDREPAGMVLNPFTGPFVLDDKLIGLLEMMLTGL